MPLSAAAKAAEENRRKKATEDAKRRAAATKKPERVKDDDVRKEPAYKPPVKPDAINRQATPPPYAQPAWRSSAPPPGAGGSRQREQGPQQPGPMLPKWRSEAPPVMNQWGDREALNSPSAGLQVSLSTPRPDRGPVGLSSGQSAPPTLTAPTVRPWRPERNVEDQTRIQAGAWGGQRETDDINRQGSAPPYAMIDPASSIRTGRALAPAALEVIGAGVQAAGKWIGDQTAGLRQDYEERQAKGMAPGNQYYEDLVKRQEAENTPGFDTGDIWRGVERGAAWADKYTFRPAMSVPIKGSDYLFGEEVSIGQMASAAGEAVNRSLNPLNPNNVAQKPIESPTADTWRDWAKRNLPAGISQELAPLLQGYGSMYDIASQNLQQSMQVRKQIDALPPEQRPAGTAALYNIISGPERVKQTLTSIVNKDKNVAALMEQAQAAKAAGDEYKAAQFGAQAAELRNKTRLELVDAQQNPWAEIMGGMFLDPTNLIPVGAVTDAVKAARQAKTFGLTAEQGVKNLDTALAASKQILDNVQPGAVTDMRTFWETVNPFARTANTRATMAADSLWAMTTQLLGNVRDKADARTLLNTLVDNPQQLITQGVQGLATAPADDAGRFVAGAGQVANKYVTEAMPILQAAKDRLRNLTSLQGEGAYTAADVMSELEDVFFNGARKMFGMEAIDLPQGTKNIKLNNLKDGTATIQYVDQAGKVLRETAPDVLYNTQVAYRDTMKTLKGAAKGGGSSALNMIPNAQRAILSDMYLNLRPANMIRNATSAMVTQMVDGIYNWTHTDDVMNFWQTKLGDMLPNQKIAQTAAGVDQPVNWSRKFWPSFNPYAALAEAGAKLTYGNTGILGSVPVGEQKFFLNGYHAAGQRAFTRGWGEAVQNTLAPMLEQLGISPELSKPFLDQIVTAGTAGGKMDVVNKLREVVSKDVVPFTLKTLGIEPETLSLQAWKQVDDLFANTLPDQAGEAADFVRNIFAQESQRYAETLLTAPPQPGVYEWTKTALTQDGAEWLDGLDEAARLAGMPPEQAQQAGAAIQQAVQGVEKLWDTFRTDLAQNANPNAADHAVDTWQRYTDLLFTTRKRVDDLSQAAIRAPKETKAQAWAAKFAGSQQAVQDFVAQAGELFANSRNALLSGQTTGQFNWWDVVNRYIQYDDAAIAQAKTVGQALAGSGSAGFNDVIAKSRGYVDKSVRELFEAYRRAPSMENYDLMVDGMRRYQQFGAQAAQFLAKERDRLGITSGAKIAASKWEEYYRIRNATWAQMFDNSVLYNNVNKRIMVANGVGQQVASGLTWTDEFAGGTFKLVGKGEGNTWQALNVDTGEMMTFADPQAMRGAEKAGGVEVPQNIINDFYQGVGQSEKIVDDVLADIAQNAPTTQNPQIGDTVWRSPQGDRVVQAEPVGEVDGVTQYKLSTGETVAESELYEYVQGSKLRSVADSEVMRAAETVAQNAPDQIAAAKDALATMRNEWDKVARGNRGYLKLENAAGLYVKDGIARVPENKFEDLYGVTIAGQRIENSADVEALLEDYARLKRQAAGQQVAASAAQAEYDRARNALQVFREANPYTVNPDNPLNLVGAEGNLYEQMSQDIARSMQNGGAKSLEVADVARHQLEQLQKAQEMILGRLPEILQGTPNTLTPAQRMALLDNLNQFLPQYDNVLAMATKAGEEAANFAMLNFNDRRNIDTVLAWIMPYHYFFSRSAKNWAIRTMKKPAVARFWYNAQRGIENENQQANLPTRMQGSVPNPLAQFGIGRDRIQNPLAFALPYAMYMPDSDDYNEGEQPFEKYVKPILSQSFPLIQYAYAAAMDNFYPQEGGKKRTAEFELGDYLPLYRMGGYAYQAATGETGPQGFMRWGDQWDPYRQTRQTGTAFAQGNLAQITGTDDEKQNQLYGFYANQVALNKQQGKPLTEGIPANYQEMAQRVHTEMAKATGADQAGNLASSYFLGLGQRDVQPGEQAMREASDQYRTLGYSADNPYGSKAAKTEHLAENPELSVWWSKNATVPGSESTAPVVSGQTVQAKDISTAIYDAQTAAKDAYITANPGAKKNDVYQAGVQAAIEEARKHVDPAKLDEYLKTNPDASAAEVIKFIQSSELPLAYQFGDSGGSGDPYAGMNPAERQQARMEAVFKEAGNLEAPVYPGNDASSAEKKAYYAAKEKYEKDRLAYIRDKLMNSGAAERGISEFTAEQIDAAYTDYLNRNKSETEVAFNAKKDAEGAANSAAWAARQASVTDAFGAEGAQLWQQYLDLPKGDARKKFLEEHPEVKVYNIVAYNPAEYAKASELFGEDAWRDWAAAPPSGDSDEAKAARAAYFAEHPQAKLLNAWVNGRPANYKAAEEGEIAEGQPQKRNFGADYEEAKTLFGDGIWDTFAQYDSRWGKAQKRAFYDKHPEYSEFLDWWYGDDGKGDFVKRSYVRSGGRGGGGRSRGGGGGGRSYGGRGYGYNGGSSSRTMELPYARQMDQDLEVTERDIRPWRPQNIDFGWMSAGRELQPDKMRPWRKPS